MAVSEVGITGENPDKFRVEGGRDFVKQVLTVMKQLADEQMTMVVVTHEMHFGERVADRVVMFDEGQIIEERPPAKIFAGADHDRTRRFLSQLSWEA